MSMIVLADEHGFVHLSKDALYERLRFPRDFVCEEAFREAIATLESPDEESNLPYENGRRIVPLSELDEIEDNRGWWIVNYLHYRDKANQDERKSQRREYMRNYMADRRKNERQDKDLKSCKQPVNSCKQISPYTDTDTDTDINTYAWELFVAHRNDIKKPLTDRAMAIAKKKLSTLSLEDQMTCVENSVEGRWTGLFPEKLRKNEAHKQRTNEFESTLARLRAQAGLD